MTGDVADRVADLRRRAERVAAALDVLVWCPVLSPGGGARLLGSLLPALVRQDSIRSVRLAIPAGALDRNAVELFDRAGVAVIEISGRRRHGVQLARTVKVHGRVIEVTGSDAWRDATVGDLARGCDVIYAPWPHQSPPPSVPVPLVCTYQDTTLIDYPEAVSFSVAMAERDHGRRWMQRSAEVVVSSRATASNLVRLFGPETVGEPRLIHHAIRPRPLTEVGEEPLPPTLPPRYVAFAGNAAVHKNLDLLVTAWSRLEERRAWPLVCFGMGTESLRGVPADDGWRAAQLAGVATRLGLHRDDGLHALGYVPDGLVRPLIDRAAALVMPSFTEGGGSFPVEEALASGVPVLCSDIAVMREHLSRRTARVVWFDPASADSIVRAVRELIADYDAIAASAVAGRDDPRPSWFDVAGQYAQVLWRAVHSGHRPMGAGALAAAEDAPAA
jgi:glycosyltransferase involved in cell wall biosynthesis